MLKTTLWLLAAETVLTPLALGIGYFLFKNFDWVHYSLNQTFLNEALSFSVPPLLLGYFLTKPQVVKLFENVLVKSDLFTVLREKTIALAFLFSAAAGFGEELLFRALIQPQVGIAISALVFAVLHAINIYFFAVALCMGMYLGIIYQHTDNLLVLIWIHFIYDVFVLWRLRSLR